MPSPTLLIAFAVRTSCKAVSRPNLIFLRPAAGSPRAFFLGGGAGCQAAELSGQVGNLPHELLHARRYSHPGVLHAPVAGVGKTFDLGLRKEIEETLEKTRSEAPIAQSPNEQQRMVSEVSQARFDLAQRGIARMALR